MTDRSRAWRLADIVRRISGRAGVRLSEPVAADSGWATSQRSGGKAVSPRGSLRDLVNAIRAIDDFYAKVVAPTLFYPTITASARQTASSMTIFGGADVPDGTLLRYEVSPAGPIGIVFWRRSGTVTVTEEQFEVAIKPLPRLFRRVTITIVLNADPTQPPATQAKLGRHGERMASDVGGHSHASWFTVVEARLDEVRMD